MECQFRIRTRALASKLPLRSTAARRSSRCCACCCCCCSRTCRRRCCAYGSCEGRRQACWCALRVGLQCGEVRVGLQCEWFSAVVQAGANRTELEKTWKRGAADVAEHARPLHCASSPHRARILPTPRIAPTWTSPEPNQARGPARRAGGAPNTGLQRRLPQQRDRPVLPRLPPARTLPPVASASAFAARTSVRARPGAADDRLAPRRVQLRRARRRRRCQ